MIKLELTKAPSKLTGKLIKDKTNKFKLDGTDVWNGFKWLKEAVYDMSFGKCVYSESKLGEEGKYPELDHFYPKSLYPDDVMKWGNLLLSNKKCNTTKSNLDPAKEPIINPFEDDPKEHLYLKNYRFYAKTTKGENTINATALNDRQHFVGKRFDIGDMIADTIGNLRADIEDDVHIFLSKTKSQRTRKINQIKRLMAEGNRKEE